jgi:ABC-2 type transport system permease protein
LIARLGAELRVVWALGVRSVKQTFRRPQLLAPILVFPTLLLAVQTGGAGRAVDIPGFPHVHGFLDFMLAGAMLQSTMLAGVSGGIALAVDIEVGFSDRLMAAPISRFSMVLGRLAGTTVLGAVAALWFLAIGLIFGAQVEAGPLGAILVVLLIAASATAFGGIGAALALRTGRASVVQGIFPLVFVILFLSSAFFPRALMLEPASSVAGYNPLSFIAEGVRNPVIAAISGGDLGKGILGIAIVGAVGMTMSMLAMRGRLKRGG